MSDDSSLYLLCAIGGAIVLFFVLHAEEIERAIAVLKNWLVLGSAWLLIFIPFGLFAYLLFKGVRPLFERPQEKTAPKKPNKKHPDKNDENLDNDEEEFERTPPVFRPRTDSPTEAEQAVFQQPKREVRLDTDSLLSTPLHAVSERIPEEINYLEHHGYQHKDFVPLGEIRRQHFLIKECKPESLEHTFVVHSIVHKLKPFVQNICTFATQKPDIVFTHNNQEYALEIETPLFLKKKHKRLIDKAQTNNARYGDCWWIVTTQSAYARSFRKYAKVLTRNQIQNWLIQLIPEARPPIE